jgi:hypothetical protein
MDFGLDNLKLEIVDGNSHRWDFCRHCPPLAIPWLDCLISLLPSLLLCLHSFSQQFQIGVAALSCD